MIKWFAERAWVSNVTSKGSFGTRSDSKIFLAYFMNARLNSYYQVGRLLSGLYKMWSFIEIPLVLKRK